MNFSFDALLLSLQKRDLLLYDLSSWIDGRGVLPLDLHTILNHNYFCIYFLTYVTTNQFREQLAKLGIIKNIGKLVTEAGEM